METKYLWHCPQCNSTDVQLRAWVWPNKSDLFADLDGSEETGYCTKCEEHLSLEFEVLTPANFSTIKNDMLVWVNDNTNPAHNGVFIIQSIDPSVCKVAISNAKTGEHYVAGINEIYLLSNPIGTLGWSCSDPDNNQYFQKVNDDLFHYREFKSYALTPAYLEQNSLTIEGLFSNDQYWIDSIIDLNEYTEEEIQKHISAYYKDLDDLKSIYGDDWKQIVCECIFEQESGLY